MRWPSLFGFSHEGLVVGLQDDPVARATETGRGVFEVIHGEADNGVDLQAGMPFLVLPDLEDPVFERRGIAHNSDR